MNTIKKSTAIMFLLPCTAFAAVPRDITSSLIEAKDDSLTVAGLALIIIIAIAAFKYMKRAV